MPGEDLQNKVIAIRSGLEEKLKEKGIESTDARFKGLMAQFEETVTGVFADTTINDEAREAALSAHKVEFEEFISTLSPAAGAALRQNSDDFTGAVETVANGEPLHVEAPEDAEIAIENAEEDPDKQAVVQAREKRRAEFAKNEKGRGLQSALRTARKASLEEQKKKYAVLKDAGANRRNGLLEDITGLKKDAVKNQLQVYKKFGVDLEKPPEEHAQAVNALKAQYAAFEKKSADESGFFDKADAAAEAEEARGIIEANKTLVLDEPPSLENIGKNFAKVNAAQANIEKASHALQAAFVESNDVIAKGKKAADDYDLIDAIPFWDTDNDENVDAANEALKELQKNIRREHSPLIANIDRYQGTVLAAAQALQGQTEFLHKEKNVKVDAMTKRKDEAITDRQNRETAAKQERKDVFNESINAVRGAHEEKLKEIRDKKTEIMTMKDQQTEYVGNQAAILDQHGQALDTEILSHQQARTNMDSVIATLQAELAKPNLDSRKKAVIEERIKILEGKRGEIDGASAALAGRDVQFTAMNGQLNVAGQNVYEKAYFAMSNLDQAENIQIVDFAQQIAGVQRSFVFDETNRAINLEEDLEALSDGFQDQIEITQEEERVTADLDEQADLHYLELEVANMAVVDNLKTQRDQLVQEEEVSAGVLDTAWNSITLKRGFTMVYDAFGVAEDSWARKYLGSLGAPLTATRDAIEGGFTWLDKKFGISDGYNRAIEWAKNLKMPVVSQAAEVLAGATDFVVDLGAGVTQLVMHPLDSATGIASLFTSWTKMKEVGKALVEYDEFGKGNSFFAATKIFGNVLLTATGIGAVGTGAKAAAQAGNVATKMGRFAKYAAQDFVKTAPRALLDTGKFIVTTPFKVVGNTLKIVSGAARGQLPQKIAAMRDASRLQKMSALKGRNDSLLKQIQKIDSAVDKAKLDTALASMAPGGVDLATAAETLVASLTITDDAARAYAKVLAGRYLQNAQRFEVLNKLDTALRAARNTAVAEAVTIAEAGFSLEKVSLDDYAALVKRFKNPDDLAAAILMDTRFGLDVKDVAHIAQAKGMAKMLTEAGGANFRKYLKTLADPLPVGDLIKFHDDAAVAAAAKTPPDTVAELAAKEASSKLTKVKAETASTTVNFGNSMVRSTMDRYCLSDDLVKARNIDELTMKILDDWDKAAATSGTPVKHFDDAAKIKDAKAFAEKLFDDREKILPTDPVKRAALKASLTDVNLLEATAASARKEGLWHGVSNKVQAWDELITKAQNELNAVGTNAVRRVELQNEINWLNVKKYTLESRKLVTVPAGALLGLAPDAVKGLLATGFTWAVSPVVGGFAFTLDGTTRLAKELKYVIANRPATTGRLKSLLNGSGEIEFVAKNAADFNAALRKLVLVVANVEDAKEKDLPPLEVVIEGSSEKEKE